MIPFRPKSGLQWFADDVEPPGEFWEGGAGANGPSGIADPRQKASPSLSSQFAATTSVWCCPMQTRQLPTLTLVVLPQRRVKVETQEPVSESCRARPVLCVELVAIKCCRNSDEMWDSWDAIGNALTNELIIPKVKMNFMATNGPSHAHGYRIRTLRSVTRRSSNSGVRGSGRIAILQLGGFRAFWRARDVGADA
jgi:hypothetical protein